MQDLNTRAVYLALPEKGGPQTTASFSPVLSAGDLRVRIAPHLVATLTQTELGTHLANCSHESDRIIRSLDLMLTGS